LVGLVGLPKKIGTISPVARDGRSLAGSFGAIASSLLFSKTSI
jgi:hypothetical protein